ncbi:TonB-dependent receptor [bacterium]|nr:TonB-dependent receptor [bacterium]
MKFILTVLSILISFSLFAKTPKIIHTPIEKAAIGEDLAIDINVTEAQDVNFVLLHYCSFIAQDWQQTEMNPIEGVFRGVIKGEDMVNGGMVYYIQVIGNNGEVVSQLGTQEMPSYIDTFVSKTKKEKFVEKNKKNDNSGGSLEDELMMFASFDTQVVTASKKAQYLSDAPAIISVINRNNIKRTGATTLVELLKSIPGVEVTLGMTGEYRVSIRGVRKEGNILLLLNGNRLNDFYDARAIFDIPADFIDRVEVIRGPGSALFGTNAVAGVINIFTVKNISSAKVMGGLNKSFGTFENYAYKGEKLKFNVSAGYYQTDGSSATVEQDKGGEWSLVGTPSTALEKNYDVNRWSKTGYLNIGGEYGDLSLSTFAIYQQRGTWIGNSFVVAPDSEYETVKILPDLTYKKSISKKIDFQGKIFADLSIYNNLIQDKPDGYVSAISSQTFDNGALTKENYFSSSYGADFQFSFNIADNFDIISGVSLEYMKINDYNLSRNYRLSTDEYYGENFGIFDENITINQEGKTRYILAGYLQADYRLEDFGFIAGFRFDHYSDFGNTFNPRLGVIYKPLTTLSFKLLYGQAFRAPTFKELYDNTNPLSDGILGRDNLEPETLKSIELGLEWSFGKHIFRANGFYNMTENLLSSFDESGAGGVGFYENKGNIDSYGFEAELVLNLHKYISLFGNISWSESIFEWNEDVFKETTIPKLEDKDKVLYNFPNILVYSGANFYFGKFSGYVAMNYVNQAINNHRRPLETLHSVKIPYHFFFHFSVAYEVIDNLEVRVTGRDIGKQKYTDPTDELDIDAFGTKGMVQPGASYTLFVTYNF